MARIQYKEKCKVCRKNYVLTTSRSQYIVCFECQKREMDQPITDPKMRKFFDIPEDFYKQNSFLRNIKINYNRYGGLTEKQIEAFEKVVAELKEAQKK